MITGTFLLELMLTFITGSLFIFLAVFAGGHFGSRTGGFIGGLPSTVILAFFFIGYTQSPGIAAEATNVFPLSIAISGLFLVVYAWFSRYGFLPGILAALAEWLILSLSLALLKPEEFVLNLLIYGFVIVLAYLILEKPLHIKAMLSHKSDPGVRTLAVRSLFGGLVILFTVLIAKIGGPLLGGIIAGFPAMLISTLAVSYRSQGLDFSRAMTKPLFVTGMITVAIYTITLRYLYVPTGLYVGTILSILAASLSAFLTYRYILPRLT